MTLEYCWIELLLNSPILFGLFIFTLTDMLLFLFAIQRMGCLVLFVLFTIESWSTGHPDWTMSIATQWEQGEYCSSFETGKCTRHTHTYSLVTFYTLFFVWFSSDKQMSRLWGNSFYFFFWTNPNRLKWNRTCSNGLIELNTMHWQATLGDFRSQIMDYDKKTKKKVSNRKFVWRTLIDTKLLSPKGYQTQ